MVEVWICVCIVFVVLFDLVSFFGCWLFVYRFNSALTLEFCLLDLICFLAISLFVRAVMLAFWFGFV